jgi:hypothetical protein
VALKEIAAGPIAIKIESGVDGTNPLRNSIGASCFEEACQLAVFSGKLPSMEAEIDCKLQSNSR